MTPLSCHGSLYSSRPRDLYLAVPCPRGYSDCFNEEVFRGIAAKLLLNREPERKKRQKNKVN